jgi:hypothetical protein
MAIGVQRPQEKESLKGSKKLRGRNASIYFSFDAEKSDDVIPEENVQFEEEQD